MGKIHTAAVRLDELALRVPVLRVAWGMFAHPSSPGDLLLVMSSAIIMAACLIMPLDGPYDTDSWFLLSTGREILENGIPYSNPFAYDAQGGEYGFVAQQWLHCVLLYASYCAFGYAGCSAVTVVLSAVFLAVLYKALRIVSEGAPATCLGLAAIAVSGCFFYMSVRPTMWTMMALCAVVSLCTLWRRSGKAAYLAGLPFVMLAHAQLHMSMMWLDVFAACCFMLPASLSALREAGVKAHVRACAPLLAAVLAMCVAAFVNPYGANGALYLFHSYGAAGYRDAISELNGILGASPLVLFLFALYVLLPVLGAVVARKVPSLQLSLLWLAGLAAFFSSVRSIWIAALCCALLVASQRRAASSFAEGERLDSVAARRMVPLVGCAVAAGAVAYTAVTAPQDVEAYDFMSDDGSFVYGICGWEQGDKEVGPLAEIIVANPGRTYVSWEILNSYLEWKGAKVVFDTRPEVWEPGITGCEGVHPWRDFVDHVMDEGAEGSYLTDGNWRWYLVSGDLAEKYCEALGLEEVASTGMFALLQPSGYEN